MFDCHLQTNKIILKCTKKQQLSKFVWGRKSKRQSSFSGRHGSTATASSVFLSLLLLPAPHEPPSMPFLEAHLSQQPARSDERRAGNACVSQCGSRCSPYT